MDAYCDNANYVVLNILRCSGKHFCVVMVLVLTCLCRQPHQRMSWKVWFYLTYARHALAERSIYIETWYLSISSSEAWQSINFTIYGNMPQMYKNVFMLNNGIYLQCHCGCTSPLLKVILCLIFSISGKPHHWSLLLTGWWNNFLP